MEKTNSIKQNSKNLEQNITNYQDMNDLNEERFIEVLKRNILSKYLYLKNIGRRQNKNENKPKNENIFSLNKNIINNKDNNVSQNNIYNNNNNKVNNNYNQNDISNNIINIRNNRNQNYLSTNINNINMNNNIQNYISNNINNINNNNNNIEVQFNTGNDLFDFNNRINPSFHGRRIVGPIRRMSPEYINNNPTISRRHFDSNDSNSPPKKSVLTQNQINQIPIEIYNPNLNYDINQCMICLDDFKQNDQLRRLECLHIYHKICIDSWLKKSNFCPIDKYKIHI